MIGDDLWPWLVLFLLGAYHGINPGMGWLFAVALGMQERSRRAVWRSLLPIATGHAGAIAVVLVLAIAAGAVVPVSRLKYGVAAILLALGIYRIFRQRHPRYGGMVVGFRDLTIWSFLMASAHGAGLMVVPVFMGMTGPAPAAAATIEADDNAADDHAAQDTGSHHHAIPDGARMSGPIAGLAATIVHTIGYLLVTGSAALIVYEKLGVALLRRAWVNLDLIWAGALIATGVFTLFL